MAEAHKRTYRHPKYKTAYRVKNWIPQIPPKTDGFISALPRSHDRIPPESNVRRLQIHRELAGRLRAKNDNAQKQEAAIGCAILNRVREMGGPLSYAVG